MISIQGTLNNVQKTITSIFNDSALDFLGTKRLRKLVSYLYASKNHFTQNFKVYIIYNNPQVYKFSRTKS